MASSIRRTNTKTKSRYRQSRCFSTSGLRHIPTLARLLVPLLASLTTLFLILPGVSGPQSGLWWIEVSINGTEGSMWRLGALGACQVDDGNTCHKGETPLAHWTSIHNLLMFHLATAAIFFILATFSSILFHFPESALTKRYGTLIPLLGSVFPVIILIADIAVAHGLQVASDIERLKRVGVYWLGPASFPLCVLWLCVVQYDGHVRRREAGEEKTTAPHSQRKEREQGLAEKTVMAAVGLWPWSRSGRGSGKEFRRDDEEEPKRKKKQSRARGK